MVVSQTKVRFANINLVLMEALAADAPWVDTEVPPDDVPVGLQVNRVGGYDDGITDYPRVQITAYAPTYLEAEDLAEDVRQTMLALGGESFTVNGKKVTVDFCRTDAPPEDAPNENPERVAIPGWYQLGLMRPRG